MREAMEAGALGMSTGLEFNPGREATIDELDAPERDRGRVRRHLHEPRPQPRLRASCTRSPSSSRSPGRAASRAEISHLNVRHNTNAPDRGWERAVEMMAAAREEGMDVLADTTPFLDGPRPARRDPAAVGRRRRHRGGARAAPRPRTRRAAADRVRPLLALHPQGRVGPRAPAGERAASRLGRPHVRADRRPRRARSVGLLLRRPRRRGRRLREHPRRRPALHRRAHGGDDLAPALLPRRRHVHRDRRGAARRRPAPSARLLRPRPLPHPPRARERDAAARGGDPQDDEHAGGALRPLGPRPPPRRATRPTSSSSTTTGSTRSRPIDDPHHYARGVEHVLVNGVAVVDGGEHTGARPGRHLLRAAACIRDRPPLRSLLGPDGRDVGGDADRPSSAGPRSGRTRR